MNVELYWSRIITGGVLICTGRHSGRVNAITFGWFCMEAK